MGESRLTFPRRPAATHLPALATFASTGAEGKGEASSPRWAHLRAPNRRGKEKCPPRAGHICERRSRRHASVRLAEMRCWIAGLQGGSPPSCNPMAVVEQVSAGARTRHPFWVRLRWATAGPQAHKWSEESSVEAREQR
jgi:hypothetical protein